MDLGRGFPPGECYPNPRDVPTTPLFPVPCPSVALPKRPSSLVVIAWRRLPCATASSVERKNTLCVFGERECLILRVNLALFARFCAFINRY